MWEKEKDQESQVIQRNGRDGISLWKWVQMYVSSTMYRYNTIRILLIYVIFIISVSYTASQCLND